MILVFSGFSSLVLTVNLGFREGVMGWDLGILLWKSGVDRVVYISAKGSVGYVEASDSCQGCNDHVMAMCIHHSRKL